MKKYLPILKNSPFFKGLTDNEILSILHCVNATTIYRKRGSYIFRAGDSTEVMGLVVSGCVLVMQEDLWGHRNILSKCHAGDFFGEPYAASPGAVLNVSVAADEDCEIIFLNVRQQLADYLCIDRAAMSTEISKLQKDGFIKTNRKHFELIVSVFR